MKGFVLLAIVLLIPTMAYFQKQHFVKRLQPRLEAAALEVLKAEGVEQPAVRMELLDAVISGRVATDARRREVAARVDALPGLRVPPESNRLQAYGWIRISRMDGRFRGEGLISRDFVVQLPEEFEVAAGWHDEMERRTTVKVPRGADGWSEFLKYYFRAGGDRSVELREGELILRGDATVGLRSDWRSKASEVVEKDEVKDELTLHPSIYHFPAYRPVTLTDPDRLAQLRRQLAENVIQFGTGGEVEVPASERDKATALARAMLQAGEVVQFVVGGHPGSEGNVTANGRRARERAEAVRALLEASGVDAGNLEVESFGVTPDGTRDNQVEVVVK